MTMKKLTLCLLVLVLFAGILWAGAGRQSAGGASGQIIEVSSLVWDRNWVPPSEGNIEGNWWTRYVDEQLAPLGIKMKWVIIPRAQEIPMLSTMLAAGNAPDLSRTNNLPLLQTYLNNGGIANITGQFNQYGAHIKALYNDAILQDIRYKGDYYWLPHIANGIETRTTFIRKDWLEAVGLPEPKTPDDFYQVLKAVKAQDPGKKGSALICLGLDTGVNDQTPYTLWDRVVLPGFVKSPPAPERFLVPFFMWPEAKDAVRYLNKLYNEGLLTDQFVLDKDESLFKQEIARGNIFAFIASGHYPYHAAYGELYAKMQETDPKATLLNVSPFRPAASSPRVEFCERNPTYGYRWFVPSTSKNVDAAVKVLDWMASDAGYLVGGLGILGQDYTMVNGVPSPIDQKKYTDRVPWIEPQYGTMAKPYPRKEDKQTFLLNYIKDFNPKYHDQIKAEVNFSSDVEYFPPTLSKPTPVADKNLGAMLNFLNANIAQLIAAPPARFDALFDAALKQYKDIGGDAVVAEAQAVWAEMK
jgi:putative aldouronate transport system substrate-binding protein